MCAITLTCPSISFMCRRIFIIILPRAFWLVFSPTIHIYPIRRTYCMSDYINIRRDYLLSI